MQRNFDFSASFNAYYLVNPNNLLTHTHTHLAHLAFKRLHVRAREARITLINKGLLGVPFVRIFVSLYEQKMNEIREQNVRTHGSCVHSAQYDSVWTSRQTSKQIHRPLERTHEPCVPTCQQGKNKIEYEENRI